MATVSALRAPRNPGAAVATNGSGQALGKTWPMLGERALYGLPGEIVRTIEPETESDPAALLLSFLVAFGSLAGPGPHALANGAQHPARLFGVVVGETAKARKGGSLAQIKRIMEHVDEEFFARRSRSGMTSGEGLIKRAADGGDKRLFVNESEFVRALVGAGRDGSTLSAVMREAWDSGDLNVMTKEEVTATGVHVCILGHITLEEAQVSITGLHAGSGFANRFLWTLARRGKLLPSGGNLDDQIVAELGRKTRDRVNEARTRGTLRRTSEAEDRWRDLYAILGDDVPGGLIGGVVARGEAQVLRLSVAYALTDASRTITLDHLEAAWGFWSYCRESAEFIFGDRVGDVLGERIWTFVRESEIGMGRFELSQALGRHVSPAAIERALRLLESQGRVTVVTVPTTGRSKQFIVPTNR